MIALSALVKRNVKLFFKDRGMFFSSLITPMILLVLYATFLSRIYRDTFAGALPAGVEVPDSVLNGCVGGQLLSSLLAVCCITVAFTSNLLLVQDKVTGARADLTVSPVRASTLALGYCVSALFSTLLICFAATGAGLLYLAVTGWYLSAADVLLLCVDVLLLSVFGTLLSSIVNFFLTSEGQMSAVGTVVSAGYGFICGAYMPISQFGEGLQKVLAFLPGTYGTSLVRNHTLRGVFAEMETALHFPESAIAGIRDSIDCNLYFFDRPVSIGWMYVILVGAVALLMAAYLLLYAFKGKKAA